MQMKRHLLTVFFYFLFLFPPSSFTFKHSNTCGMKTNHRGTQHGQSRTHWPRWASSVTNNHPLTQAHTRMHTLISRQRKLWDLVKWVIRFKPNWTVPIQIPKVDSDALTSGEYVNHQCWWSDKCFAESLKTLCLVLLSAMKQKTSKSTVNKTDASAERWYKVISDLLNMVGLLANKFTFTDGRRQCSEKCSLKEPAILQIC